MPIWYYESSEYSSLDCFANGTCQKPPSASNLLNTIAPVNWASVMSTLGKGCTSLIMLSFNGLRLTQIRIDPDGLSTITMPVHHCVGSLH